MIRESGLSGFQGLNEMEGMGLKIKRPKIKAPSVKKIVKKAVKAPTKIVKKTVKTAAKGTKVAVKTAIKNKELIAAGAALYAGQPALAAKLASSKLGKGGKMAEEAYGAYSGDISTEDLATKYAEKAASSGNNQSYAPGIEQAMSPQQSFALAKRTPSAQSKAPSGGGLFSNIFGGGSSEPQEMEEVINEQTGQRQMVPKQKSNTMIYVIGGVALVAGLGIAIVISGRSKRGIA